MFVFESMNLTDVDKKNCIERSGQNLVIPWDDPYPNISATLSESKQIVLKSLNIIDAKKEFDDKKRRLSSSGGSSSRLNEIGAGERGSSPLSIMRSRPSTKMSGKKKIFHYFVYTKMDQKTLSRAASQ
jgi:hypothetical protein